MFDQRLSASFASTVICATLLLASTAVGQTIWYVDAANCPGPGDGSAGNPFCEIQAAINAAAPSATPPDEIVVADGTSGSRQQESGFRRQDHQAAQRERGPGRVHHRLPGRRPGVLLPQRGNGRCGGSRFHDPKRERRVFQPRRAEWGKRLLLQRLEADDPELHHQR